MVPDKYELKVADNAKDFIDATDLAGFAAVAKDKKWTAAEAQTAVDEYGAALAAQSTAFRAETEADATYGGDRLTETQRLAKVALDKVRPAGTPAGDALRALLVKTGYGNHIGIVSFLADLGKLMAEDAPGRPGRDEGGGKPSLEERLYGKQPAQT